VTAFATLATIAAQLAARGVSFALVGGLAVSRRKLEEFLATTGATTARVPS
jgi:hypothetical protein